MLKNVGDKACVQVFRKKAFNLIKDEIEKNGNFDRVLPELRNITYAIVADNNVPLSSFLFPEHAHVVSKSPTLNILYVF